VIACGVGEGEQVLYTALRDERLITPGERDAGRGQCRRYLIESCLIVGFPATERQVVSVCRLNKKPIGVVVHLVIMGAVVPECVGYVFKTHDTAGESFP